MDSAEFLEILNGLLQRQSKLQKMIEFQNDRVSEMLERQFTADKVMHRVQGMLIQALGSKIYQSRQNNHQQEIPDKLQQTPIFAAQNRNNFKQMPVQDFSSSRNSHQSNFSNTKNNILPKQFHQNLNKEVSSNHQKEKSQSQHSNLIEDYQNFEVFSETSNYNNLSNHKNNFEEINSQNMISRENSQHRLNDSKFSKENSVHSNSFHSNKLSEHKMGIGLSLSKKNSGENWQRQNSLDRMNSGETNNFLNGLNSSEINKNILNGLNGNDSEPPEQAYERNSSINKNINNNNNIGRQKGIFRERSRSPSYGDQSLNDRSNSSRKRLNSIPKQLLNAKIFLKVSPDNVCLNQFRYEGNQVIPRFNGWYQLMMERPVNLNQRSYYEIKIIKSSNCNIFLGIANWDRIQSTSSYNSGKAVAMNLNDCYVHVKSTVIRNEQKRIPNDSVIRVDIENGVISWWRSHSLLAKVTIPQEICQKPAFPYLQMYDRDDRIELL